MKWRKSAAFNDDLPGSLNVLYYISQRPSEIFSEVKRSCPRRRSGKVGDALASLWTRVPPSANRISTSKARSAST